MYTEGLIIRSMEKRDIHEVYKIESESFSDMWSEETFSMYIGEEYRQYQIFVALLNEKVAAYCVTMRVLDECEILKIAVSAKLRHIGIGEKLLQTVMTHSKEENTRFFFLEVRESNAAAINLYKKLGFYETGKRKDYYSKPVEAALLMGCVV